MGDLAVIGNVYVSHYIGMYLGPPPDWRSYGSLASMHSIGDSVYLSTLYVMYVGAAVSLREVAVVGTSNGGRRRFCTQLQYKKKRPHEGVDGYSRRVPPVLFIPSRQKRTQFVYALLALFYSSLGTMT